MTINPLDERLQDLLIKEATERLDPSEARELDALIERHPAERDSVERLVAELSLAVAGPVEPMPAALSRRVTAVGEAYVAGRTPLAAPTAAVTPIGAPRSGKPSRGADYGWFAAAACLLLAVIGWYPRVVEGPAPAAQVAARAPAEDAARARAALLAQPGVVLTAFSGTPDAASAPLQGDVVWDPATQRGFLRLKGLPANDPREHQYQLWVFDASRDPKYPVDGGVFDVQATQLETIVPIRVPIAVGQAVLFAVTVERPGGVVVSGREHIVATAKPSTT